MDSYERVGGLCAGMEGRFGSMHSQTTGRGTFPCRWCFNLARRSSSIASEDWAKYIGSERVKLQVAHHASCHIAMGIIHLVRGYLLQTHEMPVRRPLAMLSVCSGGIPGKYGWDKYDEHEDSSGHGLGAVSNGGCERPFLGDDKRVTTSLMPEFCNPADRFEEIKVRLSKNVRDARHRLWQVAPDLP